MTGSADRVDALLQTARRLAEPSSAEGKRLREALYAGGALSPEGYEHALRHHLETTWTDAERVMFLDRSTPGAKRCWVLLAGNVCTAALRALALATACAPQVFVRASRRDPALCRALVEEAGLNIEMVDAVAPRPGDEVHLYGSDATLETVEARFPPGTAVRAFGSGVGVAVVDEVSEAGMEALARDLVAFDGAGCLSPRIVVARDVAATVDELHRALGAWDGRVSRGPLGPEDRAALSRTLHLYGALGHRREGSDHFVVGDPHAENLEWVPPLRGTLVIGGLTPLEPHRGLITTIASGGESSWAAQLAASCPGARRCRLGKMQRPPLDGPVDLRPAARRHIIGGG
ncbi:MAG: acyl-CoA reductase [Myxococcota bacterium]